MNVAAAVQPIGAEQPVEQVVAATAAMMARAWVPAIVSCVRLAAKLSVGMVASKLR
jgi:hypothetical protein